MEYYMVAWRYKISLLVLKKIVHSFAQYFSTLEEKSRISARPSNILYIFNCLVEVT